MDFSLFKKYSKALSNLSEDITSDLCSLAFSQREEELSVSVGTKNQETFEKILEGITLPKDFFNGNFIKYGVDLESMASDKIRIYKMFPRSSEIRIEGLYINKDGHIIEKKIYKKLSKTELTIDRYDADGNVLSEGEIEKDCSEADWNGPKEIVEEAKNNRYEFNFVKKASKNQTYFVIHDVFQE